MRYSWWDTNELHYLLHNLMRYGTNNLYLRFYPHEELDGNKGVLKLVRKDTGEIVGTYNHAHTCPPDCEEGG